MSTKTIVLRATWLSAISGPLLFLLVILGTGSWQDFPGVWALVVGPVVFRAATIPMARARRLQLTPTEAVRTGAPGTRSLPRAEVVDVVRSAIGGVVLTSRTQKRMRADVGDMPLGYLSRKRVQVIRQWAQVS